jgi:hypothetical protein
MADLKAVRQGRQNSAGQVALILDHRTPRERVTSVESLLNGHRKWWMFCPRLQSQSSSGVPNNGSCSFTGISSALHSSPPRSIPPAIRNRIVAYAPWQFNGAEWSRFREELSRSVEPFAHLHARQHGTPSKTNAFKILHDGPRG